MQTKSIIVSQTENLSPLCIKKQSEFLSLKSGFSPLISACALVTILLLRACLNTFLSLIDGKTSADRISPKIFPAPMLGNWSESPTTIILVLLLSAFKRSEKRRASIIEASSTIRQSQSRGFFSFRPNVRLSFSPHSTSNSLCMVLDSRPQSSVILFAALPVGAASSILKSLLSKSFIMAFKVVVLPVPGPPVKTSIPFSKASKIACF